MSHSSKRSLSRDGSFLRTLLSLFLVFAMVAQSYQGYAQLIGDGKIITITAGQTLVLTRPVEPVVPPPPVIISGTTAAAGLLVQKAAFGQGWYSTGIETAVIDALLTAHSLPTSDRSRLLRWERNTVRAALWNRVVEIIKKSPASRTANEQAVYVAVTLGLKNARIACAQASLDEYNKWDGNAYGYVPPAPFVWRLQPRGSISNFLVPSSVPSFEQFQQYGAAVVYADFQNDAAVQLIAAETARSIQVLGSMVASGIVGGIAGSALGGALGPTALLEIVGAILPYAVRVLGASVAGSTAFGGPIGIVVAAIVGIVFQGIAVADANALPGKLAEALTNMQAATIDLAAVAATATGLQELYAVFIKATSPDFAATEAAPPAVAADSQWLVAPFAPSPQLFRPSPTIECLDFDSNPQSVRLVDGWFVLRNAAGQERMKLTVEFLGYFGEQATLTRMGSSFFCTDATADFNSCTQTTLFYYRDWNGTTRAAKLGSGGTQASFANASLAAGAVGQAYSQTLTVTSGGPGTYTFAVPTDSVLPPGLTLSAGGILSGTPRSAGTFSFEIYASNTPTNSHPVIARVTVRITGSLAPLPTGLVAWWRLSDSTQDSVSNNHGQWANNSPVYADGQVGRAASFNTSDYIVLPDNVFPTGARSFEVWFKTTQFGAILGQSDIAGPSGLPAVYVGTDGKLRATFFYNGTGTTATSAASVTDGQWHHVAATHSGTQERVYLDGAEIGVRNYANVPYGSGNFAYTLGLARVDGWPATNGTAMLFNGLLDEAAIYNRVLTPAEISAIYAAGGSGKNAFTLGALAASTGTVGTFLTDTITVLDGATSLTATAEYSVVSGALPFGLQIGAGGVLSGVPRSAGTFAFTLRAKGADSHFGERSYSIAIAGPVQAIPDGLVAWWRVELPNHFASLPGNLHPLALASGSVPIVAGYVGSGFGLGTGTLLVPSGVLPTDGSAFSFEAWIRTTTGGTLLHRRRSVSAAEPAISVGADGLVRSQLFWNAGAQPIVSVVPVNDGNWHHLAASYAGGEERLYLDGQIAGILRGLTVPAGVSATYRIGGNDSGGDAFAGQLDEAAVYSRAITVAEVAGVFTGGGVGKSALVLNPTTLPVGYVGQAYQQTLTSPSLLTPGDFARSYSISSGALPPGLTLSVAGMLSGVPVTSGTWTATIVASDGTSTGARTYSIRVFGVPSQIPGGAVAWWRGELNPNDSAGTLHATLLGSAGYAAGISGNGFRFDGSGARVLLPATSFPSPATAPTAPFTFETWFQTRTPGVILGREDQDFPLLPFYFVPAVYVGTDGRLRAQLFWSGSVNPLTSAGRVDDGQPHHVAVTFASGVQQLFLDGALIGTRSGFTQIHDSIFSGYRYQLGTGYTLGWPAGNSYWLHFNGLIDEPATYSRALTAAEILAIYTGGDAGKTSVAPTSATLTSGRVGENFIASVFAANSGVAAVLLSGGQLPPGLALSSSGVLSGLPITAGTYTFNTAAQLSSGAWLLKNLTLRIDGTVAPNLATTGWYSGQNNLNGHAGETASAQNGVAYAAGRVGAAFSFDGSARWLSIFSVPFPAPGGAWSFETWFRTSLPGGIIGQIALSGGGAVPMLYVGTDGLLHAEPYWRGTATTLTSTARVDDGLFHHAAVTYANGVRRLYLDGTLVATQTAAGLSYGSGTYQFNVGRSVTSGWPAAPATSYFTGQIDEVQFIGREITATEVRAVFAAGDLGKSRLSLNDVLPDSPANGNEYSAFVTASGGTGPFTYRLASGRFPVGFTLGSAFGEISGVTNVTGTFDFSIEATSAAGEKGVRDYRIVVNPDRRYRAAGLRAWWQAEGNGADWNSVNPATIQGATFATGVVGQGFSFDGTDDRVELPASAFPTPGVNEAFSFETWFRCEDVGVILGQTSTLSNDTPVAGYVPLIYVGSDGRLRAQIIWTGTNNPIVSPGIVGDGTWHHVAATYDGAGTLQVFLDAQLIGTRTGVTSLGYAASYRYFLGRGFTTGWTAATTGWFYFLGEIDEASTWTRVLTASEIRMIAACGTARKADRRITPAGTLPGGVRGRPYQQAFAASGESFPNYFVTSGSLPPGMAASEITPGAPVRGIYGAPTAAGQFDFILSDYDATQVVDESMRLTIAPLTSNAAYDLWAGAAGLTGTAALPGASPFSDTSNLLKYAFNLDPTKPDTGTLTPGTGTVGLPVFSLVEISNTLYFRAEYLRRKNSSLTYAPELSTTLSTFTLMGGTPTVLPIDANWERVIQQVPAAEDRQFGRLKVQ